ncbi:hypothetical protein LBMAG53_25700 [Planctomycetota bacterium]|nr:hypothetical protein LBMAG53_25700 [Planctomycetota bacterium]
MHSGLKQLIGQFHACQELAMQALEKAGLPRPVSNHDWVGSRNSRWAELQAANHGFTIKPHGYGMAFWNDAFWIDFDIGASGQTDGFDAYRLSAFSTRNAFAVKISEADIERLVNECVNSGEIIASAYINHYLAIPRSGES